MLWDACELEENTGRSAFSNLGILEIVSTPYPAHPNLIAETSRLSHRFQGVRMHVE